jgi:hypothetical protein
LVFVLVVITVEEELFDAFHGEFFVPEGDLVGPWSKEVCVAEDFVWEGCREEDDLDLLR